jgi:hypothetical protein
MVVHGCVSVMFLAGMVDDVLLTAHRNIGGNPFTSIGAGVFAGLGNLTTL